MELFNVHMELLKETVEVAYSPVIQVMNYKDLKLELAWLTKHGVKDYHLVSLVTVLIEFQHQILL